MTDPASTLAKLRPALALIETRLPQIPPYPVCKGLSSSLSMLGAVLFLVGFLFLMGLYTNDEKLKRNSSQSRLSPFRPRLWSTPRTSLEMRS